MTIYLVLSAFASLTAALPYFYVNCFLFQFNLEVCTTSYYSIIIIIRYFVNIAVTITLVKSNKLHWIHYRFLAWSFSSSFAFSGHRLTVNPIYFCSSSVSSSSVLKIPNSPSDIIEQIPCSRVPFERPRLVQRSEDFARIFWRRFVLYHVYKSAPLVSILSQMSPLHTRPFHFFKSRFTIILPSTSGVFYSGFPTKSI